MDYSYYDEDEEERHWGPRPTPRERMRVQRAMALGRGGRGGRGRGAGSDSRSTTPPGSRLRMARSSRDVSEEAESDFSSSPSKRILRVRQRGLHSGRKIGSIFEE